MALVDHGIAHNVGDKVRDNDDELVIVINQRPYMI